MVLNGVIERNARDWLVKDMVYWQAHSLPWPRGYPAPFERLDFPYRMHDWQKEVSKLICHVCKNGRCIHSRSLVEECLPLRRRSARFEELALEPHRIEIDFRLTVGEGSRDRLLLNGIGEDHVSNYSTSGVFNGE